MFDLEIRSETRPRELRRLSNLQPLSIGRHASNEICIDEADVAPIHCRISWNRTHFEVASANRDGIDLNGTLVRQSALKVGDVLRIGSADIVLRESEDSVVLQAPRGSREPGDGGGSDPTPAHLGVPPAAAISAEVPLKPVTEETPASREGWDRGKGPASWMRGSPRRSEVIRRRIISPVPGALHERASETSRQEREPVRDDESGAPIAVSGAMEQSADDFVPPVPVRAIGRTQPRRVRPGQQEALRSPFILGMFGFALSLALAAAAIYFVIGRESAQKQYDAAQAEFDARHYTQAAELYEKFLHDQSRHKLSADANYHMWNARVLKEIAGGSPSWKRGLEAIDQYVEANRDRSDFHEHDADLVEFLTQIALGASRSAESTWQRDQLELSVSAESTLKRYVPEGKLPIDLAKRLHDASTNAQNSIVRHERYSAKVAEIEKANAERHPMAALEARRAILGLYPDMSGESRLTSLLKQTLDVEKSLVAREDLNKPAVTKEQEAAVPPHLTLTLHTRSRTDEPSGTRPVLVMAKDCCYAADHVTGEPIWRRIVGVDRPFFPMTVATSVPSILLINTNRNSLMLLARRTGKLIWEQPLNEAVSGPPLIDQGQIYLGTLGNHLYKIDLETGRISTRLTFSQKILSPPALVRNKERLVVAGDASLLYTLSTSPLACVRVNEFGHAAGSLVNGVMEIGARVLLTESGRPSGARLCVLDAGNDETWLKKVKEETIEGQVRDAPVIYGKMLFVASDPARVTAFSLSDVPGQDPLARPINVAIPKQEKAPIFLSAGPDGQLWLAGSSLRRLQLKLNAQSFALDSAELAVGISSQPLQVVGQYLFAARRLPYAGSVYFSQIERDQMTGRWRTVFGSSMIGRAVGASGEIACVGEAGEVFAIGPSELGAGGFKRSAAANLDVAPGTRTPLRATTLDDGQIAVDSGGPKPSVSLVTAGGQIAASFAIDQPLEASPVRMGAGLVLPLPGRLRLVSPSSGIAAGEDFLAPIQPGKPVRWKQLLLLDETDLVVADSRGRLARLQYRTEPLHHLAEMSSKTRSGPIDVGLCIAASRVAVADPDGTISLLDGSTLEPVLTEKLASPAVGALWGVGSLVVVETRDHHLLCYEAAGKPHLKFRIPLEKTGPAGCPVLVGGRVVIANRDGTVWGVDASKGTIEAKTSVGQPLSGDVIAAAGRPVVTSIDGTLYRADAVLEKPRPARKAAR